METPFKFVLTIGIFWLCLGGLFQLFNVGEMEGSLDIKSQSKTGSFTFIFDLMTFNIEGIPSFIRWSITTFLSLSLTLSIYVLLRGQ